MSTTTGFNKEAGARADSDSHHDPVGEATRRAEEAARHGEETARIGMEAFRDVQKQALDLAAEQSGAMVEVMRAAWQMWFPTRAASAFWMPPGRPPTSSYRRKNGCWTWR